MQVYKGKKVKYRLIKDDQGRMEACWYAGLTAPKIEFIPRATGVAAKPARPITQDTARAQVVSFGSIPDAGYAYSEEDRNSGLAGALDALCGGPCVQLQTFEQRWHIK